ncbi:Mre11 DNA-binding presumed domain-containing protein [Thamnocephalis sphaerospora]|uniref:Mre11 DNA-binding presumed domain-containing protein n=1 Tax=Thamnocephalis sphaerospora TaxID=78915 RepID=A0A4P9XK02_9FUNG|nr:Mre11 DNA-binding presumed domain-containing protein [Thamnocephalis sphaerospora]|eukprot:RKP05540.1 Mre11 DNA-binding presumed domain-containing protein [Thamnocephalis sphaerospora]
MQTCLCVRVRQLEQANTISILVATDNHLGYMEKDPVRGQDSFQTFEEILRIAQERQVDMVLLGGDLFHDNKPSRKTMHTTMGLLRKYCMGERPCPIEFLSDQTVNFPDQFATVNYMDPNYNVAIPVFSIHGNHDDPSGDGNLCALDMLSVCGLCNYFGRAKRVDDITISPLLMRKGATRLALFGLGNVRDERLHRTFIKRKVKVLRPSEDAAEWFNLMVIHQNRVAHGPTNYIPEAFLDDLFNLVLWGHEHECLVDPQLNVQQQFYVSQPGSSVATSLSEGESKPKHVGLLHIQGTKFTMEKIPLRTVRPFVMQDVSLSAVHGLRPSDEKGVAEYLTDKVNRMIDEAHSNWEAARGNGAAQEECPKPLIRLRVDYSGGFTPFNPQRFGQQFVDQVANPKDLLYYHRKRTQAERRNAEAIKINLDAIMPEKLDLFRVEDLVDEFLALHSLEVLPENALGDAVRQFVEKDDRDAIKEYVADKGVVGDTCSRVLVEQLCKQLIRFDAPDTRCTDCHIRRRNRCTGVCVCVCVCGRFSISL